MADLMTFPDTVEEFMEQYKITDTDQVYTNGADLVPIFRMRQWFEHAADVQPVRHGRWNNDGTCSLCGHCDWDFADGLYFRYCPNCGAKMEASE